MSNTVDPDSRLKGVLTRDEISTREIEQNIRKEQGAKDRMPVGMVKFLVQELKMTRTLLLQIIITMV